MIETMRNHIHHVYTEKKITNKESVGGDQMSNAKNMVR